MWTWSVAPRFDLSGAASVYARIARGYRPGGPNFVPPGAPADYPTEFSADTVTRYEVGLRAQTLDRSAVLDLALFHLDWDDILITSTVTTAAGPVGVNSNGRRARSQGLKATLTLRSADGLTMIANTAITDAKLLDDTVPPGGGANLTGGLAGDRLPYTPRVSASLSADYDFRLADAVLAYVGTSIRIMGDQTGGFNSAYRTAFGRPIEIDGYVTLDVRAGVEFGRFSVAMYGRNLTDSYGIVSAGEFPFAVLPAIGGNGVQLATATTIRPRTLGAMFGVRF